MMCQMPTDLAGIKGKTIRKKRKWLTTEYINIPQEIITKLRLIMLMGDVMFVNLVPFSVTFRRVLVC